MKLEFFISGFCNAKINSYPLILNESDIIILHKTNDKFEFFISRFFSKLTLIPSN